MTLYDLIPGQRATISSVAGDRGPLAQRLMALGLLEGTEVALLRKALGGDPVEIEVMGYALSLRRDEALRIQVKLADAARR